MAATSDIHADAPSRFLVGIDLGTTNSALAYVDTAEQRWIVRDLSIPQLVAPATVESRQTLPSFHYESAAGEFAPSSLRLPWSKDEPAYAVGVFARDHGSAAPGRAVVSAKSWLSHSGVDRSAGLLPWHGAPDVQRLSPVEASARYLAHLRSAWDAQFPEHPMAEQDVVLTAPASFDEVARELTIQAAREAGLVHVVLVEEPQAAFYAWISAQGEKWDRHVKPGQKILVCDVGGGTSDFTLIRVRPAGGGKVLFHRVAVGEHLILGGDNLDLAIAHHVEQKLGKKLEPRDWGPLVRRSRGVKETLLGSEAPERMIVNVSAGGSKLVGASLQVELTREEIQNLLLDGFLPRVGLDDKPIARRSGFQEFGLPYARDAAITRYLAAFLSAHRRDGAKQDDDNSPDHDPARPDLVLFNGGLFESPILRDRLVDVLSSWFSDAGAWKPEVLKNDRLDLAVSRGAAYYGMVRRGHGVRISGGLAHSYYIGVEGGAVGDEHVDDPQATTSHPEDQVFDSRGRKPRISAESDLPPQERSGASALGYDNARGSHEFRQQIVADAGDIPTEPGKVSPLSPPYSGERVGARGESSNDIVDALSRDVPSPQPSPLGTGEREPGAESGAASESIRAHSRQHSGAKEQRVEHAQATALAFTRAVCLLPAGVEEGQVVDLADRTFTLLIRQPVEFPLYASSTRTTDGPGDLLAVDPEQMTALPPIRTVLQSGKKAAGESIVVRLHAKLTEIGTLDIWCAEVKGDRTWQLRFDVRAATRADAARHQAVAEAEGVLDDQVVEGARQRIVAAFQRGAASDDRPESLVKRLEATIGIGRHDWPSTLLRSLWETLMQVEPGRRISDVHEARWLNLTGYCLRPGYGLAADDWRVGRTWKLLPAGVVHPKNEAVRAEWWILWRRLAGGMTAGQQRTLAEPLVADWRLWLRKGGQNVRGRSPLFQFGPHESAEVWRLLGSLELLSPAAKQELGDVILERLAREQAPSLREAELFALGRVGARMPMYGPLDALVPVETAEAWASQVMGVSLKDEKATFAVVQLCRRTGDRYRDVSDDVREAALAWLAARNAPRRLQSLVREVGELETEEQRTVFGESLPRGLRIE